MRVLKLINISKQYSNFRLDIPELFFKTGEIACISGPNGSGKSTLLMIMSGVVHPDTGRITLDDADITGLPIEMRRFPLIRSERSIPDNLTPNTLLRIVKKVDNVDEIIDLLDLREHMKKRISELSSGWRIRVAIALALASNPIFILIDEALEYLDNNYIRCCIKDLLRYIVENDIGLVIVSQRFRCCDRKIILDSGRIDKVIDLNGDWEKIECF